MDYLGIIEDLPHHIRDAVKLASGVKVDGDINSVLVTGMGGSGIPANIVAALLKDSKIPVVVNKDYVIPAFVNDKTLVFVVSYSGNTEETLSAFKEVQKKHAKLVVVTSGGKLKQSDVGVKQIIIPAGMPPRSAVGFLLFPILVVLHNSKILKLSNDEILKVVDALHLRELRSKAVELSQQLFGKIPLVYASPSLEPVALRWKQAINENAKQHAFWNVFPELNHNEMMAYNSNSSAFHVVLLRDEKDGVRIQKRIDLTKAVVKKAGASVTEVMLKGESLLVKMMTAIFMGDLVSYHLGIKNNADPAETIMIEEFKTKLSKGYK